MTPTSADAAAIRAAVALFFDRVLANPALERYWIGVDEPRLRRHALAFILQALGGPALYDGDMRSAHAPLGIDDADFDRVAAELMASLSEVGVSAGVVELAGLRVAELRPVIVTA
ncbi:MAG TPA: group 1 truncated hemoglobin [Pseudolysinimonas sp.]|nr:group 1 truncated hemoglobin [Pseudolysinimonas sp.]